MCRKNYHKENLLNLTVGTEEDCRGTGLKKILQIQYAVLSIWAATLNKAPLLYEAHFTLKKLFFSTKPRLIKEKTGLVVIFLIF